MLKKLGISALAALMALGALSITEASYSDNAQNTLCGRGGYCYNQNSDNDSRNSGYCGDGYCRRDGGCGCW